MNNNRISPKQAMFMIIMFIIGSSTLMVMGLEAKNDLWISIIIAIFASSLIMLIYAKLLTVHPDKDFFDTLEYYLGRVGSKIAISLLTWFSFDLCAIVLRNYGQFISTVGLKETPMVVSMALMIFLCSLAVKYGLETIGRWVQYFGLYIMAFLIISFFLASGNMKINNILPVFDDGLVPILKGSFGLITFPFVETVIFLLILPNFKKGVSVNKIFFKGLLIGGGFILLTSLMDMLVLGQLVEDMYYPTYATLSTVSFGDFIHRLEAIAAIVFVIAVFLKLSLLLLGACNGTARLFGIKNNRFIVIPITLLVLNLSINSFNDMIYYQEWVEKAFRYYGSLFEIIIPLAILIIIKIKIRRSQKSPSKR